MRRIDAEFAVRVTADTSAAFADIERFRLAQEADSINLSVDVDTNKARANVAGLRRDIDGAGMSLRGFGILAATSLAPAAVTAVAALAQGMQQVAQAGLVMPGAIGGAIASIGTFALGANGMADAIKATSKAIGGTAADAEKADAAMAKLSPSAAEVVRTLVDLKPVVTDLYRATSGPMFEGLSGSIRQLVANDFPAVRKGLVGIAEGWNANLKQLTSTLGDDQSRGLIDRILGNTGDAQKRFTAAIDPIVKGIGTLTAGSTQALPRLADGLAKASERFRTFITAADADGRLNKWINDGIDGVTKLGNSVLNIGKAFAAITKAQGGDFLGWLQKSTNKLQEFLNSDAGQEKLKKMFESGKAVLEQLEPIVANLAKMLPPMLEGAANATGLWLPLLQEVTDLLAGHPALIEAVATAFLAWKTIDGVSTLAKTLGTVTGLLKNELPAAAATGAAGISSALASVAVPAWLGFLIAKERSGMNWGNGDQVSSMPTPGDFDLSKRTPAEVMLGPWVGPALDRLTGNAPKKGYIKGGPTPSGRGDGPTGGFISELHGDEWVLPAHARAKVGDEALWALTTGRSFAAGGYVDKNGNPVTPGNSPGPSSPAGGIAQSALGSFGGPFSGLITAATSGGDLMSAAATLPGLWGALASAASPDPTTALANWGSQTMDWSTNFLSNTVQGFGSALLDGGLGIFGLQQSILSPSNPWNQAGQSVANFALGGSGPLAGLMGGGRGGRGRSGGGTGTGGGDDATMGLDGADHLSEDRGGSAAKKKMKLDWPTIDALAARAGLKMTSGYRSGDGPTVAGVRAAKSYHASGRAHDYSNGRQTSEELNFANFMVQAYGPKLKELIYDDPRFGSTINNGRDVGPFGGFYTLGQAGDHSDHVHVAFDTGGWLMPGQTVAHNFTRQPELVLNGSGQQKLRSQGIDPASLLPSGAPGQAPSSVAPAGDLGSQVLAAMPAIAAAPTTSDHNLGAISKGISSASSAIGSLASTAAGAAGMSVPGLGAAGGLASGAVQMGGQIIAGAMNLGSSLLVGSVPGSFGGSTDRAYGRPVRQQQQAPAPTRGVVNNFNGISDVNRIIQEFDLKDAQHRALNAKYG